MHNEFLNEIISGIGKILLAKPCDDLYMITDDLSSKISSKLKNALEHYPVDAHDSPLALIDTTVFGSAKTGMLISGEGVYWKNGWTTTTTATELKWNDFINSKEIIKSDGADLYLTNGCVFGMSGSKMKSKDLEVIFKLIILFLKEVDSTNKQVNADGKDLNESGLNIAWEQLTLGLTLERLGLKRGRSSAAEFAGELKRLEPDIEKSFELEIEKWLELEVEMLSHTEFYNEFEKLSLEFQKLDNIKLTKFNELMKRLELVREEKLNIIINKAFGLTVRDKFLPKFMDEFKTLCSKCETLVDCKYKLSIAKFTDEARDISLEIERFEINADLFIENASKISDLFKVLGLSHKEKIKIVSELSNANSRFSGMIRREQLPKITDESRGLELKCEKLSLEIDKLSTENVIDKVKQLKIEAEQLELKTELSVVALIKYVGELESAHDELSVRFDSIFEKQRWFEENYDEIMSAVRNGINGIDESYGIKDADEIYAVKVLNGFADAVIKCTHEVEELKPTLDIRLEDLSVTEFAILIKKLELIIEEMALWLDRIQALFFSRQLSQEALLSHSKEYNKQHKKRSITRAGLASSSMGSAGLVAENVPMNGSRGHGFAAERANHLYDRLTGKDASIVGGDNAKNGADRLVDGINIQTKYCKSGSKSIAECFDKDGFRYYSADGTPMQIEVPSDLYEDAVKAMEARIRKGQVEGVTNPEKAKEIVRKGNITYAQAKNIARFGTVESICFDAVEGIKIAGTAMGVSAGISFAVQLWHGEDWEIALESAVYDGLKVGGTAWVGSILTSQVGRTGIEQSLRGTTDWMVQQIGPKATAWLANGLRSGSNVYGASAANHVSKVLRGGIITVGVTTLVSSYSDFSRLFNGRMSGAQVFKNMTVTGTSVAVGGVAGTWAAAAVGTAIMPGVGTAIGIIAGALGAMLGSTVAGGVMGEFIEDDADEMLEILTDAFGKLAVDYLFNKEDADVAFSFLEKIDLPELLMDMYACSEDKETREIFARNTLEPMFEELAKNRAIIQLPSDRQLIATTRKVIEKIIDN